MSAERKDEQEGFLGRWSRRKIEARESPPEDPPPAPPQAAAEEGAPQLPAIDDLTLESDFSGFFHPEVDEDLRRSALRKLFSDPHFNVMDGLDTYIDDYSKSEPIPPAMLAGLKQAQRILDWAAGKEDDATAEPESPANENVAAVAIASVPDAAEAVPPEPVPESPQQRDPVRGPEK
jgi:hypothetical protein